MYIWELCSPLLLEILAMIKIRLKIVFIFLGTLILLMGCTIISHKSKLHLINETFNSDSVKFRIDGIYYLVNDHAPNTILLSITDSTSKFPKSVVNSSHRAITVKPLIFYNNGYVYKGSAGFGAFTYKNELERENVVQKCISKIENRILENTFHYRIEDSIWDWGLYNQEGDSIIVQCYFNHFGGYRLIDWNGFVKNDSTIIFTSKYGYKFHKSPQIIDEIINEIYHFKSFAVKPDSINYILNHSHKFGEK